LGEWKLELWAPKALHASAARAEKAYQDQCLPLVLAKNELERLGVLGAKELEAHLTCDNFLQARAAVDGQAVGAFLPAFLVPGRAAKSLVRVQLPRLDSRTFYFYLAWNPRLLRLNPHATRRRDWLAVSLAKLLSGSPAG
jgi:DNA-binding transcriptional LysR family regulator